MATAGALQPLDPLIQELRLLCRDELHLIEQRTALVNQLQQASPEYYQARWKPLTTGPIPSLGNSSWPFPLRRRWFRPANGGGRSSCIPTSSGGPRRPKSG